eukprot:3233111-Prymnesium_polylepis.1
MGSSGRSGAPRRAPRRVMASAGVVPPAPPAPGRRELGGGIWARAAKGELIGPGTSSSPSSRARFMLGLPQMLGS